jgi:LysM repeat protein
MTATLYPSRQTDQAAAGTGDDVDYAARRVVAVMLAVVVVAVLAIAGSALVSAAADVGGRPAVASDIGAVTPAMPAVHVAQPGDTLWSIADRYRGDVGHGRFVDALVDLNGGAAIQIGQAVRLP